MNSIRFFKNCLAILLVSAGAVSAQSDNEQARTLRRMMADHSGSVVGVELTITGKSEGVSGSSLRELPSEGIATAISPQGLVVTSLAGLDFLRLGVDRRSELQMQASKTSPSSNMVIRSTRMESANVLKNIRIRRNDGRWVPARVVLQDEELDLLFLAPETADTGYVYPFIDLTKTATHEHGAKYYAPFRELSDLGWVANIQSVVAGIAITTPRSFYLGMVTQSGAPVLDVDGKILGLITFRAIDGKPRMTSKAICAVAEIAEPARQALQLATQ